MLSPGPNGDAGGRDFGRLSFGSSRWKTQGFKGRRFAGSGQGSAACLLRPKGRLGGNEVGSVDPHGADTIAKHGLQSLNVYFAASAGMISRSTISSESGPA